MQEESRYLLDQGDFRRIVYRIKNLFVFDGVIFSDDVVAVVDVVLG